MKIDINVWLIVVLGIILIAMYLIYRISNYQDKKLANNIKSEKQKVNEALENFDNFDNFDRENRI